MKTFIRILKRMTYEDEGIGEVNFVEKGTKMVCDNIEETFGVSPQKLVDDGFAEYVNSNGIPLKTLDEELEEIRKKQDKNQIGLRTLEELAFKLHDDGFNIITVEPETKKPYTPLGTKNPYEWKIYQEKRLSKDRLKQAIDAIIKEGKKYLIGMIPGEIIEGTYKGFRSWGIDFDDPENIKLLDITLEKCLKNGTWLEKTRKKGHHLYGITKTKKNSEKQHEAKLEFFGTTGYLIIYNNFEHELYELQATDVEDVFTGFTNILFEKKGIKRTKGSTASDLKKGVISGSRNDSAFKLASELRDSNYDVNVATNTLMAWNRKNKPPLSDNEIINCIRSAYRKKGEADENKALMKQYKVIKYKKVVDQEGNERYIPSGIRCQNMAKMIIKELGYHFLTLEEKAKPIWYFNGKYYKPNGEIKIGEILESFIPKLFTKTILIEVVTYIQYNNVKTRLDFVPPLNLINLENGIYDLNTGELENHSHKYLFNYVIPINYDSSAKCPHYKKFLKEITTKEEQERPDVYDTLQEYLGYCFYRDYEYKKYLVMDGENDNGKTTLMNIWIKVIGKNNIASIPLQELNDKAFRKDKLFGKHGNFADELPNKGMRYSGIIKEITGRSPIWADIKNHQEGVWFINYAKPFFACNQIPETSDIGNAFFSRQLQVTLHNKYLPKNNPDINNITCFERNTKIEEIITTSEEISGIFNHAIEGLKRLQKNKRFSDTTTTEEKRKTWLKKSDPIMSYFNEEIEETTIDWCITCQNFKKEIERYCKKNNITIDITLNKITRKLSNLDIVKTRKSIDGNQKWVFLGIQHITDTTLNEYIGRKNEETSNQVMF